MKAKLRCPFVCLITYNTEYSSVENISLESIKNEVDGQDTICITYRRRGVRNVVGEYISNQITDKVSNSRLYITLLTKEYSGEKVVHF